MASNVLLQALEMLGNVVDTPGSVARGLGSAAVRGVGSLFGMDHGENAMRDFGRAFGGVFDPSQRVYGSEWTGEPISGMALDIGTDPLNLLGGLGLLRGALSKSNAALKMGPRYATTVDELKRLAPGHDWMHHPSIAAEVPPGSVHIGEGLDRVVFHQPKTGQVTKIGGGDIRRLDVADMLQPSRARELEVTGVDQNWGWSSSPDDKVKLIVEHEPFMEMGTIPKKTFREMREHLVDQDIDPWDIAWGKTDINRGNLGMTPSGQVMVTDVGAIREMKQLPSLAAKVHGINREAYDLMRTKYGVPDTFLESIGKAHSSPEFGPASEYFQNYNRALPTFGVPEDVIGGMFKASMVPTAQLPFTETITGSSPGRLTEAIFRLLGVDKAVQKRLAKEAKVYRGGSYGTPFSTPPSPGRTAPSPLLAALAGLNVGRTGTYL